MSLKRNSLTLVGGSTHAGSAKSRSVNARASTKVARAADAAPASPPESVYLRDSYAATAFAELIDRSSHAALARFTAGLSPMTLMGAYADWAAHLAALPGKRTQLAEKALRKWLRFATYAARSAVAQDGNEPCIEPLPQDKRFSADA